MSAPSKERTPPTIQTKSEIANGAVDLAKNGAGRTKNAGANDGADKEEEKIAEAQCADEFRHGAAGAARRFRLEAS